jgi:hypothetical protein
MNEQEEIAKIKAMSQSQLARLSRHAPAGHPYFDSTLPYDKVFKECFKGWTPELSKQIGW